MKYTGDINLASTYEIQLQKPVDPRLHFIDEEDLANSVEDNYTRWYNGMKIFVHSTGKEYFYLDRNALPDIYTSVPELLGDPVLYSGYPDEEYTDKEFNFFEVLGATVTKTDVGLPNVDNTSDLNKPISTLTQTALNAKTSVNDAATNSTNTWSSTKIDTEIQAVIDSTLPIATYDPNEIAGDVFDVDNHVDGTTNKVFTATEKTKLSNITAAAEPNNISDAEATDLTDGGDSVLHYHATDRDRANHLGTQTYSTISNFDVGVVAVVNYEEKDADFTIQATHNKGIIHCELGCDTITLPTLIDGFICYIYNNTGSTLAIATPAVGTSPVANESLSFLLGVPTVGWVLKTIA